MKTAVAGIAIAVAAMTAACGAGPSPTSTAAPSSPPPGIALRLAPADLGCDSMAPPYRAVTFAIDATAAEAVTAVANTGARLLTYWSASFRGGSITDPVVWDAIGNVVARDGEQLVIPAAAWPRLHGHFVCPSTDALYVFDKDPS
jgi:hypothetical protein